MLPDSISQPNYCPGNADRMQDKSMLNVDNDDDTNRYRWAKFGSYCQLPLFRTLAPKASVRRVRAGE